jgi:mono/diheme cytochrome c family protein
MPNIDQSEHHDVVDLHAAVLREKPEPKEGFEPVNLWLVALTGALLFWGGSYLSNYSGRFDADEYDERPHGPQIAAAKPETEEEKLKRLGQMVFTGNCVACHNDDGAGKPGVGPPLAGSDWVNAEGAARLIRLVLDGAAGPIKVSGQDYNFPAGMNPWRDQLNDLQVAGVLTFVRSSWGNKGGMVKPDDVKGLRDSTKDHAGKQWAAADLLQIPLTSGAAPAAASTNAVAVAATPDALKAQLKALPPEQLKALLQEITPK